MLALRSADVVLMVYRESYYLRRDLRNATGDKAEELSLRLEGCENDLEILVPKNRNGDGEAMVVGRAAAGDGSVRRGPESRFSRAPTADRCVLRPRRFHGLVVPA